MLYAQPTGLEMGEKYENKRSNYRTAKRFYSGNER